MTDKARPLLSGINVLIVEDQYLIADELDARSIPFAFATGYEDWVIPPEYRGRLRVQKPVSEVALRRAITATLGRD